MATTETLDEGPLQFGRREPGCDYPDRPAAFGVAMRDGRIALAHIAREGWTPYFDLPGGGIDPGEAPEQAMAREFGEETGLIARAVRQLVRVDQYLLKTDGDTANNRCSIYEAEILGEDPNLKTEADHALAWMAPQEALRRLRLNSHGWAVAAWIRARA